jgi:TRAP-type transport system periplasmic protein
MFKPLNWIGIIAASLLLSLSPAKSQPFTLKIGSGTVNDTSQEWLRLFKAGVEQRSGGKIKVETYVASALGPNPRVVEGVALGTIEAGVPNTGFWVSLEPRFIVFDAVGIFDTPEQSVKVLQDPEIHKLLSSYGTSKGVETISVFWHSPLALMTKKPVRAPADFAGLKLRTPGGAPLAVKPVEKLKASPISMPINDALPALQNGVVDGVISGSTVGATLKYYDVAKYMTLLPKSMIFVAAVVNSEFMKKLGPELSAIVREEATKAEMPAVTWGVADAQNALDTWKKNGGEVIEMTGKTADEYLSDVTQVGRSILQQNPAAFADYNSLLAASKKYH